MTAQIFDGKRFAKKKETHLRKEVKKLREKAIVPRLASIMVGDNQASKHYLGLKKKATQRIGAQLHIVSLSATSRTDVLIDKVRMLNDDNGVHGVMVQLPFPKKISKSDREEIINTIDKNKDVDGMREDSHFLAPVVKAVLLAIREGSLHLANNEEKEVVVVGSEGFVGKKIVKVLREMGYRAKGVDIETKNLKPKTKNADILITATGQPGLITGAMVKPQAVVIDLGAPKGDVQFNEVAKKASFATPVPGGIGPVTIACLLENLVEASQGKIAK